MGGGNYLDGDLRGCEGRLVSTLRLAESSFDGGALWCQCWLLGGGFRWQGSPALVGRRAPGSVSAALAATLAVAAASASAYAIRL